MSVRVRELALEVALPARLEARAPAIVAQAEKDFIPAVLDALDRRVTARHGQGAILRVRHLSVRWGLAYSRLSDAAYAEQLGEELAAEIERRIPAGARNRPIPPDDAPVVAYRSRANLDAARLVAGARGQAAGPQRPSFADAWDGLFAEGADPLIAALEVCAEAHELDAVLGRLDDAQLLRLAALPEEAWRDAAGTQLRAALARLPTTEARGAWPAEEATAPRSGGDPPSAPDERRRGKKTSASLEDAARGSDHVDPAEPVREARDEAVGRMEAASDDGRSQPRGTQARQDSLTSAERDGPTRGGPDPSARARVVEAPEPEEPVRGALPEQDRRTFVTRFGGLFYLVNAMLRLELPERLWRVGVVEGDVLCAFARRVIGPEGKDDDGPRVLTATPGAGDPPVPVFGKWAVKELRDGCEAELASLCAGWLEPASACRAQLATRVGWFAMEGEASSAAFDLVAWGAGLLAVAAEAMLGREVEPGRLRTMLAIPGRIVVDRQAIGVTLPIDAIDIDVRRAGLDADPGYLPWLGRKLVLEFEEGMAPVDRAG